MTGKPEPAGTDYVFGPFRLSLPPGWTGNCEDGVHTISSDTQDAAIQFSGFEREMPVALSDLYGMVPEGADGLGRFTLPSGLDGFSWRDAEPEIGMQVVRAGTAVLAISIIGSGEQDENVTGEILRSLALVRETMA